MVFSRYAVLSAFKDILVTLILSYTLFNTTSYASQWVLQPQDELQPDYSEIEAALHEHNVRLENIHHLNGPRPRHGCEAACNTLHILFPRQLISRERNGFAYGNFVGSYWSKQQREVSPLCIFSPQNATEVAIQVLVSRLMICPFAVRGGGHASFAGASNIGDGIVMSLNDLNEIEIMTSSTSASTAITSNAANPDPSPLTVVRIGAGNHWREVYRTLEQNNTNLTVVGGRDADVGVSGLLLGGGLSFFSNLYGFACDNVAAFEVVLASGRVVMARPGPDQEFADLYWALRGGGNNFGVVTAFHLFAVPLPQGLIWGGAEVMFDAEAFSPLLGAFYNLGMGIGAATGVGSEGAGDAESNGDPSGFDGKASQILAFTHVDDSLVANVMLQYAEPVARVPPVFVEYMKILGRTEWSSAVAPFTFSVPDASSSAGPFVNCSLVDMTELFSRGQPSGRRNLYRTATFKLSRFLIEYAIEMFDLILRTSPAVHIGIAEFFPAINLQTISASALRNARKNGGNPLGLEGNEPRVLVTIIMSWRDAVDDEMVDTMSRQLLDRLSEIADDALCDCRDEYIYMNYASRDQNVIASYGRKNHKMMWRVAKKYDPHSVFQKLLPGYHKM
ncbi:FAD-binding domain-containing protein [Xylariaceae sp. FL1651]|nr:FAD-binding domain-containing protein [Xylariaceae sp. FL1651]